VHDIITNTTTHVSFIFGAIKIVLHGEGVRIDFDDIENNISFFIFIIKMIDTSQETNSLSVLFQAAAFFIW